MKFELKSPENERASIQVPSEIAHLSKPFNGVLCSQEGDEYEVTNNIIDILGKDPSFSSVASYTNHWKLTAHIYEDIWRKRSLSLLTGEDFPIEKEHELLIEWTAPKEGGLYLDLGCSTALYGRALKAAQKKADIVALDFSMQMLEEARLKAEADETDLFFVRADGKEMPFFSKTFDGIVMGGTLNELTDEMKVLYDARRVLKEDGKLFMMHLIKSDAWYGRLLQESMGLGGLKFWTKKESNKLFEQAGFGIEEQITRGIVCFTLLKVQ
ncbi:class I SAM-dependent methyltransferase [Balneola vulgaris]|uniref:class I SAM-dependent methyltransferase n=1 Tax=Balneola vulgaris TaxID=287535 RepID=UPI000375DAA9|nr:class I SAM-dependent methyltransferase [Balneola vulgaris]